MTTIIEKAKRFGRLRTYGTDKNNPEHFARPAAPLGVDFGRLAGADDLTVGDVWSLAEACEAAQRERDEAWRSRERLDCRFAGRFVEMSGSHCPLENPCVRCQAESAEAALASLREQVRKFLDSIPGDTPISWVGAGEWFALKKLLDGKSAAVRTADPEA